MAEEYDIGLNCNDHSIRESADSEYVSFWEGEARKLEWFSPWSRALEWNLPFARWFKDGMINASYNALDVHQKSKSAKPAILWEGEDGSSRRITYGQLLEMVGQFAGVLASLGVKKGDRVAIYLPMVPELPVAMLACARIGAVHTVIFSGFSAASVRSRIVDSGSRVLVTADGGYRRGKIIPLKEIADEAVSHLDVTCVVLERTNQKIHMNPRDRLWSELVASPLDAVPLESSHPLFILYTSGTTGTPKGVLHGTGGYLTHVHSTFRWAFDIRDSDVYFCTADIGWITGHSYVVYAPLLCGATQVMYEGAPDYPDASRICQILQKYGITIFYTTPTAIRMLAKSGSPDTFDLSSLRLLGTVGEPINPSVWRWYYEHVGKKRCPIVDTWWQTETGGMMISALPGIETIPLKPGSATHYIPGIDIAIVDEEGRSVPPHTRGHLVVKRPWPGMLLTLWGDDSRYKEAYWSRYPGCYYSGDYAMCDDDKYVWLLGRADDVLKVAGHRIGTAEIEGSLVSHPQVAESAVCAIPDNLKGQAIAAFVVLKEGADCRRDLAETVRRDVGSIAVPKIICVVPRLPKTRSGKILRRILKAIACGEEIGDTSTLEDPGAVSDVSVAFARCQVD
ncbi:MAG: acetate--CoA ligase [Nitrosopumilus sp. D6]|nr:MAG: acetate--CoA ligase [Nitrosopumilus sp. D6]